MLRYERGDEEVKPAGVFGWQRAIVSWPLPASIWPCFNLVSVLRRMVPEVPILASVLGQCPLAAVILQSMLGVIPDARFVGFSIEPCLKHIVNFGTHPPIVDMLFIS